MTLFLIRVLFIICIKFMIKLCHKHKTLVLNFLYFIIPFYTQTSQRKKQTFSLTAQTPPFPHSFSRSMALTCFMSPSGDTWKYSSFRSLFSYVPPAESLVIRLASSILNLFFLCEGVSFESNKVSTFTTFLPVLKILWLIKNKSLFFN